MEEKRCTHQQWEFAPKSCCDKSFICIYPGCGKRTKAYKIKGTIHSGEIATIDENGIARRISSLVR